MSSNVLPKAPREKKDVSDAIGEDWARVSRGRKGAFADAIGVSCTETVNNAITGRAVPELHTALNSLLDDPSALFNVLQLVGGVFVQTNPARIGDMALISQMLHAATEAVDRKRDGHWCPADKAALAKLFTPLVPALLAIIREANGGGG